MRSQDHVANGGADEGHGGLPVVIGVAPALADRVRLAELLHGFGPVGLVFVATVDEARLLLESTVPVGGNGGGTGHHNSDRGRGEGGNGQRAGPGGSSLASGGGEATASGSHDRSAGKGGDHLAGGAGNGHGGGGGQPVNGQRGNGQHGNGQWVNGQRTNVQPGGGQHGNGQRTNGQPGGGQRSRRLAGLTVDSDLLLASRNGHRVGLTPLEHDLLLRLGSEPRQTWTHAQLHESVWNTRPVGGHADIHSVVKRLRRKLAVLGTSASIDSIRGVGFRLADGPDNHDVPDGSYSSDNRDGPDGPHGPGEPDQPDEPKN